MNPLAKIYLNESAGEESRVGIMKRATNDSIYRGIELMLEEECPLVVTCDVKPIHPPYFSEFCYVDIMGGILLFTLSAEINYRMSDLAVQCPASKTFDVGKVMDKYVLDKPRNHYRKIVFLPGSNYAGAIDQCALQKLMMDDEWVIKLHPLTHEGMIRDLASIYGYRRLIEPEISGMALLHKAETIATVSTSELLFIARLLGKSVVNITRADREWLTTYGHLARHIDNTEEDFTKINNLFMSEYSGYLRPEYADGTNRKLAQTYFNQAMQLREIWRPLANQRLIVGDKTFIEWDN